MRLKILSAVVILAGTAAGILMVTQARQARQDPPVTNGFMRTMHSDLLDEDRQLFVYLPRLYDPAKKERFPLFVFTDGRMSFKATAGMIHSLIEGGTIPRMVVVGIANTDRGRDLIPTKIVEGGNAGGGAKFLASLETEILPYIDANWPTNGFRVFSGHSLGGLTSLKPLKSGVYNIQDTWESLQRVFGHLAASRAVILYYSGSYRPLCKLSTSVDLWFTRSPLYGIKTVVILTSLLDIALHKIGCALQHWSYSTLFSWISGNKNGLQNWIDQNTGTECLPLLCK